MEKIVSVKICTRCNGGTTLLGKIRILNQEQTKKGVIKIEEIECLGLCGFFRVMSVLIERQNQPFTGQKDLGFFKYTGEDPARTIREYIDNYKQR